MARIIIAINEGINSSAVFAENGECLFAIEEERLSRQKNPIGFPHLAISRGMDYLGLSPSDIACVLFSNLVSPATSYEEFIGAYEKPYNSGPSDKGGEFWRQLARRLVPDTLLTMRRKRILGSLDQRWTDELAKHGLEKKQIVRSDHHANHAASAYYGLLSITDRRHHETLSISLDGGGDQSCSQVYACTGNDMRMLGDTPLGHSLGNIYSRVTHLLGFKPHEHEYKLMGMAPYVDIEHARPVADILHGYLDIDPETPYCFRRKIPEPTHQIGPRLARDLQRMRFDSIAAGLQLFTEELIERWVAGIVAASGIRRIVAAGGVFMNVKANMRIASLEVIEHFDVFPSCGDETLPFGALWLNEANKGNDVNPGPFNIYLGPSINDDLGTALDKYADLIEATRVTHPAADAATRIADGKIVAWCQGRMEFGARALGRRSILARPDDPAVTARINKKIKSRDFWMPFAPAMTRDAAEKMLAIPASLPRPRISPWMMHAFETQGSNNAMIAALHPYDRTARAQIVDPETAPEFHELLEEIGKRTRISVTMNTSFNLHGYPICTTSSDAIETLLNSDIDALYLDDMYLTKKDLK